MKAAPLKKNISICICTYKRPNLIKDLLGSLYKQATENLFTFEIVVIDNDKLRTAERVVYNFKKEVNIDLIYDVEERQSIPLARNKAIEKAKGELIAFIDDDEIPRENWLLDLFKAMEIYKADAVLGPVFPLYQIKPPVWVIKGKFFQRPIYRTGTKIVWTMGRTGNLLIKKSLFELTGIYFDPKFSQGGEDQDLARRMLESGYRFVWCNEARAYEIIPPERWNLKYMFRKALIRGKMSALFPGSKLFAVIKSIIAIIVYCLSLPFLLFIGYHFFVEYLVKIGDHLGRTMAILDLIK
jgi:succinoglycan biosynthesis protein ExoM